MPQVSEREAEELESKIKEAGMLLDKAQITKATLERSLAALGNECANWKGDFGRALAEGDALRAEVARLRLILGDYREDHPERDPLYLQGVADGARAEREACAALVDEIRDDDSPRHGGGDCCARVLRWAAEAIRDRGNANGEGDA